MREAARKRCIYHLWWHPHNFGRHAHENLMFLTRILEYYNGLREETGMASMNMGELADALGEPTLQGNGQANN
jgi:hypothetical protein